VNIGFVNLGISRDIFDGFEGAAKKVLAKFFEAGTSRRLGENTLGTLASGTETT
jgi:hypothetical protein